MKASDKVRSLEELAEVCRVARERQQRVVFSNGCFDLLHIGHVRYLEAARSLGDLLIVAVNSDRSVNQIKGPLRPVVSEAERCELVAALHCVDYVCLFDTPDPLPVIISLLPHILVKGADWAPGQTVGAREVKQAGGEVVHIPLVSGVSTTKIIERILDRFREKGETTMHV
jgi:D-glycero-beta-D-manno-heptose 1-phosphate adenylyltransferase